MMKVEVRWREGLLNRPHHMVVELVDEERALYPDFLYSTGCGFNRFVQAVSLTSYWPPHRPRAKHLELRPVA